MGVGPKNVLLLLGRYVPKLHQGVARFAAQHQWHLNVEWTYFGRLPKRWEGDGILALLDAREDLVDFINTARVPVVDMSILREDIRLPRVAGDNTLIGRVGAEHFLERAFHNFACFSSIIDDPASRLRLRGFRERLGVDGFACESWSFVQPKDARHDEWTLKRDYLARQVRAIPKPAAVFAFCDADAGYVLEACDNAGLVVPEEIAILGVDNNELICESLRVPLSSVNQDFAGIGYAGGKLLQRLMSGEPAPVEPLLIPPQGITVRRSTEILAIRHEPTRRALQFLRANYRRRIGAGEVAVACGMSRSNLDRAFRRHLGGTVNDHLVTLRLIRAKELLRQTDLSAADVAAQAGFNTPQYFNNVFHRATGMTPGRFRQWHRANPGRITPGEERQRAGNRSARAEGPKPGAEPPTTLNAVAVGADA